VSAIESERVLSRQDAEVIYKVVARLLNLRFFFWSRSFVHGFGIFDRL
jgi:hypothetical protein